ncbi:MAG: hypothetical protein WC708_12275 [Lentisphaeria bacterium]
MTPIAPLIMLATAGLPAGGRAAEPWPAEPCTAATTLTHLDPAFKKNMSGACYNPETETFWVCCNGGPSAFWALKRDKNGTWGIATKGGKPARYDVGEGDLEDICQADYRKERVYLMLEGADKIREYDTSHYGRAKLRREWDISAHVPTQGGAGSEGITFVPDDWLKKGTFTDAGGNPYVSRGGLGGLMLVAHQNGGGIYAFDLGADRPAVHFVGAYRSSREESSGLGFDRSSGLLYIWHNTGPNYLEVTRLASTAEGNGRRLLTVREFTGPKGGNLEGIALVPATAGNGLCLIVDDDNQDGAALMLFRQFDFTKVLPNGVAAPMNSPVPMPPNVRQAILPARGAP